VAVKLTFCGEKKNSTGKRNQVYQNNNNKKHKQETTTKDKQTGHIDFSSVPNTCETIKACSHTAMAHFSRLIVNTATALTLTGRH